MSEQYKTIKTTMGHKIRVPMSEQEIFEKQLLALMMTLFPFVATALMFWLWIKVGG